MTRRPCAIYVVGITCAVLLVAGIGLVVAQVFRTIMHNRLKKEIVLVEGSRVFESWKTPPPPVYMEFFFFNVTNVNDFLKGAKPEVKQVGPYTYREYRYKDNVSMLENNETVSAYNTKSFVFLREKSVGDPAVDNITTVNIPAWAVMTKVKGSFFRSSMVSIWMNAVGSGIFTTHTVDELLWGYEDPLLVRVSSTNPEVEKVFGLMYKKNGSNNGEFVYHTGVQNYLDYGRVKTWKGESKLTFWSSNQSNSINGSDGSAFHPLLKKDERIYIFTPDLCRSIYMEFEKDVEVKGIPAYRFTPPRSVLASKEENPANEGFCVSQDECLGTGVLKVSPCRRGAPVVASFPHFYLADSKYVAAIEGMSPHRKHHQTFLDLNPTTGVIVRASKRAQINVLLSRISGFPATRGLNNTIFPVMFLNESVVIDDASAARVHKLLLIVTVVSNLPLIIVGLGAILLIVLIILLVRARKQKNEVKRIVFTKPLYAASTEEDTSYSPVSDKEKEDPQNGTFIGLTAKAED
ncbi:lysosome membrane protein 2-like isoform X1 [Micropterus salmoides]|uniref:lysosome membrane protein 2-like isoform X1 n=1 Tax=Micropterus salmoides TaxID=27706 RepID=UPI0018ECFAB7|nr:lysosome membrane protein 2-like isoform X1 [Micropterus salmoides]XP_038590486.1 lysosome membrane protein 2-like isoform X1 [Micropterus salmoides]XP_038590487.1 lysosome membrane protein 2-like isoform X1 [Micropterus salmoides]